MTALRLPICLAAVLSLAACSPPAAPDGTPAAALPVQEAPDRATAAPTSPIVVAPAPKQTPDTGTVEAERPEPRPRAVRMADDWVGRWDGPEGLFLEISPGPATNTVRLRLKDNLDSVADYEGVLLDNAIQFERKGRIETIRRGAGADTGFSGLRSRTTCLIVRTGEEGYCRPASRSR